MLEVAVQEEPHYLHDEVMNGPRISGHECQLTIGDTWLVMM